MHAHKKMIVTTMTLLLPQLQYTCPKSAVVHLVLLTSKAVISWTMWNALWSVVEVANIFLSAT